MASVFPIDVDELSRVARRASEVSGELVEVVNLNSPRQQVLSGATPAVVAALHILEEEHFVDARIIERQVPMHSSIFTPVGGRFADYLAEHVSFATPSLPYLPNRLAQLVEAPTRVQFIELLSSHVHRPVLWRQSIDLVLGSWPQATLVEVGPRSVLFNLLDRKWHRGISKHHVDVSDNPAEHLRDLIATLSSLPWQGNRSDEATARACEVRRASGG
jgi:[acyl-carrier-protein] S-malonyltransferase